MSYDADDNWYLSREELDSGGLRFSGIVPDEDEPDDELSGSGSTNWETMFDKEGAQLLITALSSPAEIRARLSQYVLEGEKDLIITRYSRRERLPAEFRAAAERADAIPILLKSFLKKVVRLFPDQSLLTEIMAFSSTLKHNHAKKTVFDRVGDVQAYLHSKADEQQGPGAHLDLPSALMGNVLSSCRLHLSLQDMFGASTTYWSVVWDSEVARSAQEAAQPTAGFIPVGKKRIKLWRVPKMKPITHFASPQSRGILNELSRLCAEVPVDEYRVLALQALHTAPEGP